MSVHSKRPNFGRRIGNAQLEGVELIRWRLHTERALAERALVWLWRRGQTSDERRDLVTRHLNFRGFDQDDAAWLSLQAGKVASGQEVDRWDMQAAMNLLPKYAGQVARGLKNGAL